MAALPRRAASAMSRSTKTSGVGDAETHQMPLSDGVTLEAPGVEQLREGCLVQRQAVRRVRDPEVDASVDRLPPATQQEERSESAA